MHIAYFCLVWLVAGLMTGLTSFGSNLIAVPLISIVFDLRDSILIGCLGAAFIFLGLAVIYRKDIAWLDTIMLTAGAFAGIPAGIWFLKSAGPKALMAAAGGSLLAFLVWQIIANLHGRGAKPIRAFWALPLGVASGVMMGSVGMGGPPLAVCVFLRKYNAHQSISTINAASVGIILGVLPWQYFSGLFPAKIIQLGILGGMCGVAGIILSIPYIRKIDIRLFRSLLLGMIALSAIMLVWRCF